MGNFPPFKTFDPVKGKAPDYPFSSIHRIAVRARKLLKSRTAKQIDSVASRMDYVLAENIRTFNKTGDTDDASVDDLQQCIYKWGDIGGEEFPDGRPYEYFAVLSLWMLADVMEWLNRRIKVKRFHVLDEAEAAYVNLRHCLSMAGKYAIKAMEAVCYAECLFEVEQREQGHVKNFAKFQELSKQQVDERKKQSITHKKLQYERHRKTREARALVTADWEKDPYKFQSASKAGKYYADWLVKEGHTTHPYEERTVTGWILDHAKKIEVRFR